MKYNGTSYSTGYYVGLITMFFIDTVTDFVDDVTFFHWFFMLFVAVVFNVTVRIIAKKWIS